MRTVGYSSAVVLAAALVASAQPPGTPALPAAALPAADPELDRHLLGWQKTMAEAKNFSAQFEQVKMQAPLNKAHKYAGSVLCMKPNLARMSNANVKDKNDFVAYICNGKSLFQYEWQQKLVTEIPLADGMGDNLMLDFLSGMSADAAKKRFHIKLERRNPPDTNYIYLNIAPKLPKDAQEFSMLQMALYHPAVPKPYVPYLPAMVKMKKPNGDSETWAFSKQTVNATNVGPQMFQYEKPQGTGWQYKKEQVRPPAPGFAAPPMLPGGNGLRPGEGAVKPQR
ncbi:MAG TPA: TIGR03009 domain-containing protein [Urbifossiella sp.]|nr:TIGR03009 domain-containing protein [Urbifossiella sp.]